MGRGKEALADAEKAIELNPDFGYAYAALGNAYLQMGFPKEKVYETIDRLREVSATWKDKEARAQAAPRLGVA